MTDYRSQIRQTLQAMSNTALEYQASLHKGGIDGEEIERELARRAHCTHEHETEGEPEIEGGYRYVEILCADCGEFIRDENTPV